MTVASEIRDDTKWPEPLSLEAALREVDPGATVVPVWVVRRAIDLDEGIALRPALHWPPGSVYRISREALKAWIADRRLDISGQLPDTPVISLFERPDAELFRTMRCDELFRRHWQALFHSKIRYTLLAKNISQEDLSALINQLGRAAFNEARFVLMRERYISFHALPNETFCALAAAYLEIVKFCPELLSAYFPSLNDPVAFERLIGQLLDVEGILRQTRPQGSADAVACPDHPCATDKPDAARRSAVVDETLDPTLFTRAEQAAELGNTVRAAILRQRAAPEASERGYVCAAARHDIKRLADRLVKAMDTPADCDRWRSALSALLLRSTQQWWSAERRVLYDLQKVCVNAETEVYSMNVVPWLLELCRRPLRRPQPYQRYVLMTRSLRSALHRLPRTHLPEEDHAVLDKLLHASLERVETLTRSQLRPIIEPALSPDLQPTNAVERVAKDKLVEELLDNLMKHGYINLSNVRDAVSRNQLKFPNIERPGQFAHDPLFAIDRRLADRLDGVYHRGELYLRAFQKISSIFFATRIGQRLTRTVLVPFGGAYIILAGIDHTLLLLIRKITRIQWPKLEEVERLWKEPFTVSRVVLPNIAFLITGFMLLGIVNWPEFRVQARKWFGKIGRGIHAVLIDYPQRLARWPAMRRIIRSRPAYLFFNFVGKPLVFAMALWIVMPRRMSVPTRQMLAVGCFLFTNVLINCRAGRELEQVFRHWLRSVGARITSEIWVDLFHVVLYRFRVALDEFNRMLYAVDEWLRFRGQPDQAAIVFKSVLGIFWFYVSYIIRALVNLIVEPQINPIKHFPVVTVSHKLILPTVLPKLSSVFIGLGMAKARGRALATVITTGIPGIFGFLAWELRSNWTLYSANRSRTLKPVHFASHGETLRRLLRPGFHSGTIPRLYERYRKLQLQDLREAWMADWAETEEHRFDESMEHVTKDVKRFVIWELLALLNRHPLWQATPVSVRGVQLLPTRIWVDLACGAIDGSAMRISFEQREGWILAQIETPGWLAKLDVARRQMFGAALAGLYKFAGVDLVAEQIQRKLNAAAFDVSADSLIVWTAPGQTAHSYRLVEPMPADARQDLLFRSSTMSWESWVALWESGDAQASGTEQDVLPELKEPAAELATSEG